MQPNTSWQWQVENKEQQLLVLGSCVELQLQLGRFKLVMGKIFFTKRNIQHWKKLPRQDVESPCLVVSNTQIKKKATADLI